MKSLKYLSFGVMQVDELYGILATVADNIRTGKFTCRLAQKAHQQVGVHFNVLVHMMLFESCFN